MHGVIRSFRGYFTALLLELLDQPLTRHEMRDFIQRMGLSGRQNRVLRDAQLNLERDLAQARELRLLEEKDGQYFLTPGGREIAEHMQEAIPAFMTWVSSAETASLVSIVAHVVLSILKLSVGFLAGSAGLLADGIDNTFDTLSSVLVWLGIKHDRERLASVFILITMFVSVGGVALIALNKILHPGPITEGLTAFIISALCGLVMLGLSAYQYTVGQKRSNLAILCQAVDSRNHFYTSLLVCGGILLSFAAGVWSAPWLYHADAAASAIIGLLILKGAIELSQEIFKSSDDPADISHFLKRALERKREKVIFDWIKSQLQHEPLMKQDLESKFIADFCEQAPKILVLSGTGYRPESGTDLHRYLDRFVEQQKLIIDEGRYWIASRK